MKEYPEIPVVENAPEDRFDGGHLWLQEKIDGAHVRFQLQKSGVIRFGDRDRVFAPDDAPEAYRHTIRYVRERLDREALRESVANTESVVFFGEATSKRTVDYDWERLPSFLGFDVWSGDRFLPPDAVEQIYDRLGLRPVNVFQKEVRATDFDPDAYEIPESQWYDGPAEGVVLRTKTGRRAKLLHPRFEGVEDATPVEADAEALAEGYVTRGRVETIARELEERGRPTGFDPVYERVLEDLFRREHGRLLHGASDLDVGEFRSEVAARVRQFVDGRA